tara:strand:- start:623 stop:913 length:291 start_codon:yes stop_codon:yes gene_type:complete
MKIGDIVLKNPETWVENEFDGWGRGQGEGIVIKPPFTLEPGSLDVRWETGRCFEQESQLIKKEADDPCPDCGTQLESPMGGGERCPNEECGYWFCF